MNSELHVIFGSGPLGKWTARELVTMGRHVRMINRSGKAAGLPAGIEVVKGDAYKLELNMQLVEGATAIYQCAQPEYHEWQEKFPAMQSAILGAAIQNGAKFIAAENLYMYGDTKGVPMTEQTPYNAHTKKGRVRQQMTEAIFAAYNAGQVRAAAVRGSDFFGPDDMIYTENLFLPALQDKPVNAMGRLDQPHTWTFAPDFGKALAIVGTRDEALGQVWHVPSNAPMSQQEMLDLISAEIDTLVKARVAGKLMLTVIGLFNKTLAEMPEMLYEFTQPFIMESSKFTQTFGMQATPIKQAVAETIAFARSMDAAHPKE